MKNIIYTAFVCILLCSCSSVGNYKIGDQQGSLKSDYDSVEIKIKSEDPDVTSDKINDIKIAVIGQIMASGRFQRIATKNAIPDIIIDININRYRTVSPFVRSLMWMAAGSNQLGANVIIHDGKSYKIICSFDAYGQSSAHPFSSETSYSDALKQFSQQIVLALNN